MASRKSESLKTAYCNSKFKFKDKPSSFGELPVSVLTQIFKNLSEDDLTRNVSRVCQKWNYAASTPVLWRRMTIRGKKIPSDHVCRRIKRFTELEEIYLKNIMDTQIVLGHIIVYRKNIKSITVRYCEGLSEFKLRGLIRVCENLELLDLKGTVFKGLKFYQELATLRHLKSINLSNNRLLTKHNILTVVLNCRKLEEFKLSICKFKQVIAEKEWAFIIKSMSKNLKSIHLDAATVGNYTFNTILECPNICEIGLFNAFNLTSEVFMKLLDYPVHLKTLKLRFAHFIEGRNIRDITTHERMKDLTIVDLTGCFKITDDAIQGLGSCKGLRVLILKSAKRITTLKPIIANCAKLKLLNIAFCLGLKVDKTLLGLPNLDTLFIHKSKMFNELVKTILEMNLSIDIKLCLSEYNKDYEHLKKVKSHSGDYLDDCEYENLLQTELSPYIQVE